MLFPELVAGSDRTALRFADTELTYRELARLAGHLAAELRGRRRVAVWAPPTVETCVSVVGALVAGVAVVPVNPKIGERELAHILADSAPDVVLAAPDAELPGPLARLPRLPVQLTPAERAAAARAHRAGRRDARVRRLHLRHHRPAEGRGAAPPRGRRPTSTRSPRPGRGRRTTCSCTGCRCSTCTG